MCSACVCVQCGGDATVLSRICRCGPVFDPDLLGPVLTVRHIPYQEEGLERYQLQAAPHFSANMNIKSFSAQVCAVQQSVSSSDK